MPEANVKILGPSEAADLNNSKDQTNLAKAKVAKVHLSVGLGAGPISVQELRGLLHEALAKVCFLHQSQSRVVGREGVQIQVQNPGSRFVALMQQRTCCPYTFLQPLEDLPGQGRKLRVSVRSGQPSSTATCLKERPDRQGKVSVEEQPQLNAAGPQSTQTAQLSLQKAKILPLGGSLLHLRTGIESLTASCFTAGR